MVDRGAKRTDTLADRALGAKLKAARVAAGLSQAEVGRALGVSFQQVQKYEKGSNRISAVSLKVLADLLGASMAELLSRGRNDG